MPKKKPKKGKKYKLLASTSLLVGHETQAQSGKTPQLFRESPLAMPYAEIPQVYYNIPSGAHTHLTAGQLAALGRFKGVIPLRKFGRGIVGTVYTPLSIGDHLWLPTVAKTVRVKAGGNIADTAAGTGLRTVRVIGVDENWEYAQEDLTLAGAPASAATATTFLRVNRVSGLTAGTGKANAGPVVIEASDSSDDIATIATDHAQSEIAHISVPKGYVYIPSQIILFVDATKPADIDILAMYQDGPHRKIQDIVGASGEVVIPTRGASAWPAQTDLWIEGKVAASTAEISVWVDGDYIRVDDGT